MKKKISTFVLTGMLGIGILVPMASAAASHEYGYNKTTMQNYSFYKHDTVYHAAGMTKKGIAYRTDYASGGNWAKLFLDYTGPYAVTYQKYDFPN